MAKKTEKRIVWDTPKIEEAARKMDDGYILKSYEMPFFEGREGLKKAKLSFRLSDTELDEYMKCKLDMNHFFENYCFVKSEDGDFHKIQLRDYQEDMIDLFKSNKLNILMASRQVGKCVDFSTEVDIMTDDGTEYTTQLFKIYHKSLENKTIYDYLRYGIYSILSSKYMK